MAILYLTVLGVTTIPLRMPLASMIQRRRQRMNRKKREDDNEANSNNTNTGTV